MSAQAYGSAFQALSYTETESKKRLCNAMFNASVELDGAGYSSGREKKKKKRSRTDVSKYRSILQDSPSTHQNCKEFVAGVIKMHHRR